MREETPDRVIDGRLQPIVLPTIQQQRHRIDGHKVVVVEESDRGGVAITSYSRPLSFYLRQDFINRLQYRAGNKLYLLHRAAGLHEHYTRMRFGDTGGSYDLEMHSVSTKEFIEATQAITDPAVRKVVARVCIDEQFAGKRGGMNLLREGLDDLISHFKLRRK